MTKIISTPKELMESRYEAFVKQDWKYLAQTSVSQTEEELQDSPPLEWLRLDIVYAKDNIVEFKAYYRQNNTIEVLHEKSYFVKEKGILKYKDGELYNSRVERNISCPCGSGKKFKKCCL